MNQKGHSDWSGMIFLFLFAGIGLLLAEGGLIAATIIWWRYMAARIGFGILAIVGLIFIIKLLVGK